MIPSPTPILQINNLTKNFPIRKGLFDVSESFVKAVDSVTFTIHRGETLGLVGESGSGKTTVGRCILRAIDPSGGEIHFRPEPNVNVDMAKIPRKEVRKYRHYMHMIFQDPYSSLSPRMTVRDIIAEPLISNRWENGNRDAINERVREVALLCGLTVEHLRRYPHAFSGGQRQRIGIARSLALSPSFLVCDEPVSALDVSIQAQIINLLMDLQKQFHLSYLFVAHDLSVVEHICNRVAVIYLGQLVELAATSELFYSPLHPYTEALMSAIPVADPDKVMRPMVLPGEIPDPNKRVAGCPFHPRCRFCQDVCRGQVPEWREVQPGHFAACHFAGELQVMGINEFAQ
jgi:peptide/nickel transport system ATP-binding protein